MTDTTRANRLNGLQTDGLALTPDGGDSQTLKSGAPQGACGFEAHSGHTDRSKRSARPKALDLFCGAGGATKGLQRAGFHVTGVDINPQPRYCGDEFIQADALGLNLDFLMSFDFLWAGPPCQSYSAAMKHLAKPQPQLIGHVRAVLELAGLPYVIENVPGAPLLAPVMLCGMMFGRALYRHRMFEARWPIKTPQHFEHKVRASAAGHFEEDTFISVAGHVAPVRLAEAVMDIDWMTREELAESIPPYFSEFIGKQAIQFVEVLA